MTTTPITRYRGDTAPDQFILVDANGAVVDISTGYSFLLTVDTRAEPSDDSTQLFQLVGTVVSGPAGKFEFRPNSTQADQAPGKYYFDVQVTDPSGGIKTVDKEKYVFKQDIGK